MLWLLGAIFGLGAAGYSVFSTLGKMGGDFEKVFRKAPELAESAFGEGAYGRVTGVATSHDVLPAVPGLGVPCLAYELVVYQTSSPHAGGAWRIVHRERVGVDVDVAVGVHTVRVAAQDALLLRATGHDANHDLRREPGYGIFTSHVRFVRPGATVEVVGTLMREVDADPSAARDYRNAAERFRVIGKRAQPILIAVSGPES
ncbi:MAG: hypothetical protein KF773_10055 [Deltaproteobacteria bacterium]|nr:hypothetical protein [Deltaproteobacteria bacterium]MCW5802799.1 hypothetical protein [Deltaproteobacteria bacterium]